MAAVRKHAGVRGLFLCFCCFSSCVFASVAYVEALVQKWCCNDDILLLSHFSSMCYLLIILLHCLKCQVPPRFKHLYEKHNVRFASEADDILKQLNQSLKKMHSNRLASLLVDVDAAMREGDGPSVVFSTDASQPDDHGNVQNDRASQADDASK